MANIVAQWFGRPPETSLAANFNQEEIEVSVLKNFLISHAKDYPEINPSILEWAIRFFDYSDATATASTYPENLSEKEFSVITNIESTYLSCGTLAELPALVARVAHCGNYFGDQASLEAKLLPHLYKQPTPNAYLYIKKNQDNFFHSFQVFLPFYEWMTARNCSFYEILNTLDPKLRTWVLIECAILGPYFLEVFFNHSFDKNELGPLLRTISEQNKQRLIRALDGQLKYAPQHLTITAKILLTVLNNRENKELFENAFPELLTSNQYDFRKFIYQQCPIAYTRSLLKKITSDFFVLPECSTIALTCYIFKIQTFGSISIESYKPGLSVSPFYISFPLTEFHELSLAYKKEFVLFLLENPLTIIYLNRCDPETFQDLKDSCELYTLDAVHLENLPVFNKDVLDAIQLLFSTKQIKLSHYQIISHLIRKCSLGSFTSMQAARIAPLLYFAPIDLSIDLLMIQDLNGQLLFTVMAQNPQCQNQLAKDIFTLLQISPENATATLNYFANLWKGSTLEKLCEIKIFRDNIALFGLEPCLRMVQEEKLSESILYFFITELTGEHFLYFVNRYIKDSFYITLTETPFDWESSTGSLTELVTQISPDSPWGYQLLVNSYLNYFVELDFILLFSIKQPHLNHFLCLLPYAPKNLLPYIAEILPEKHKHLLLCPDFTNELLRSFKKMTPTTQKFFFNHLTQWLAPNPPNIQILLAQSAEKNCLDKKDILSNSLDFYLTQLKNLLSTTVPVLESMTLALPFADKLKNYVEKNMPIYEQLRNDFNKHLPHLPDELICHLSGRLLENPAQLVTYPKLFFDRDFLQQIAEGEQATCPYTRTPLTAKSILIPLTEDEKTRNIKKQCRKYQKDLEISLQKFIDSYLPLV